MILLEHNQKKYSAETVIARLKPLTTPERWNKICAVVEKRSKALCTVVENIYDKGNTSAVMRSAEAFGYHLFHHIIPGNEFKESKRVTQGADKWLVQQEWQNTTECIQALKTQGFSIFVTSLEGGIPIDQAPTSRPIALCLGNEKEGASQELLQLADEKIFIPMQGFVQSFNISVAGALCLQHFRQSHGRLGIGRLNKEEVLDLQARYLIKSCKSPHLHLDNRGEKRVTRP